MNIPLELLPSKLNSLPKDGLILVYDSNGKKGHQALRTLVGAGFTHVINVSGGFASLSGYVRAITPTGFQLILPQPEQKQIGDAGEGDKAASVVKESKVENTNETLVIDVRTVEEFATGAYPGAINIPLDNIESKLSELGKKDRKIILYCASGGRSSYALQILKSAGFTNLENGGGISRMMAMYQK